MRFNVTIDGGYTAVIDIEFIGDEFKGEIEAGQFGQGEVCGNRNGNTLTGAVFIKGYDADFKAKLNGTLITGNISYGWFFDKTFSGVQTS